MADAECVVGAGTAVACPSEWPAEVRRGGGGCWIHLLDKGIWGGFELLWTVSENGHSIDDLSELPGIGMNGFVRVSFIFIRLSFPMAMSIQKRQKLFWIFGSDIIVSGKVGTALSLAVSQVCSHTPIFAITSV